MFARIRSNKAGNLLLELGLIVLGISIALGLEGWAQDREDARTEQVYLRGLQEDLEVDRAFLDQLVRANQRKLEELQRLIPGLGELAEAGSEQQAETMFAPATYHFFQPANFTYVALQESGDFRLLSDPEIQRSLLRLNRHYQLIETLQTNYMQALDDVYIPLMMAGFDLASMAITDPRMAQNQVFLNSFVFALQETSQRLQALENAQQEVDGLIAKIETQRDS